MDKQVKNIKLLNDGTIRFKTGRIEKPRNEVWKIEDGVVYFILNNNTYVGKVNLDDYFKLSLWAHRLTFDHADINKGVIAYDNGYEHKSLAAAVKQTSKLEKVTYLNACRLDCTKENLVIKANNYLAAV